MPSTTTSKKQNAQSKVGIFMPYYNMEDYIDEGLDSLYAQTFDDFIVTIADDASPSKTATPKLSTVKRPRCHIYYEKKNLGLIKIANKYMAQLDAEYIMLFSPDDKLHPDFLKEQVAYLDAHPNVHAVCTWIQEFGEGDQLIKYDDARCRLPDMLVSNNFAGAALMRKSAWLAADMHDTNPELYPNLDYDLWLSMLQKGFTLGTIPKPLFYWRVVDNSLSHGVNADQTLVFRKALFKKYMSLYQKYFDYVLPHYLEELNRFEKYYTINEEGHAWLDEQYHRLTNETLRLSEENAVLKSKLSRSIQRPYVRSVYHKVKRRLKR